MAGLTEMPAVCRVSGLMQWTRDYAPAAGRHCMSIQFAANESDACIYAHQLN